MQRMIKPAPTSHSTVAFEWQRDWPNATLVCSDGDVKSHFGAYGIGAEQSTMVHRAPATRFQEYVVPTAAEMHA